MKTPEIVIIHASPFDEQHLGKGMKVPGLKNFQLDEIETLSKLLVKKKKKKKLPEIDGRLL